MTEADNAMLEKAIEVAVVAHAGQTAENGEASILHPLRVMQAVRDQGSSIEQQVAAVLHRVIEECEIPDDFLADRFPVEVCDLVDALTKIEGEDDKTFLYRVARTPGAVLIKEAAARDILGRLQLVRDAATRARLRQKYRRTLKLLDEGRLQAADPCLGHECDRCSVCRKGRCCRRDLRLAAQGADHWPYEIVGQRGIIEYDEEGRLLCHVCGYAFHHLTAHARRHGIPPRAYRSYFGLRPEQLLKSASFINTVAARNSETARLRPVLRVSWPCVICGTMIGWRKGTKPKTCSPACRSALTSQNQRGRKRGGQARFAKYCSVCGALITRRIPSSGGIPRTCSDECAREAIRRARSNRPRRTVTIV